VLFYSFELLSYIWEIRWLIDGLPEGGKGLRVDKYTWAGTVSNIQKGKKCQQSQHSKKKKNTRVAEKHNISYVWRSITNKTVAVQRMAVNSLLAVAKVDRMGRIIQKRKQGPKIAIRTFLMVEWRNEYISKCVLSVTIFPWSQLFSPPFTWSEYQSGI
jgi:hypothetical protein